MSFQVDGYQPDNLAALLSEAQDKGAAPSYDMSALSYDEAMNYAPPAITQPMQLGGLSEGGDTLNPVWYFLAAGAAAYYFFMRKERGYGY